MKTTIEMRFVTALATSLLWLAVAETVQAAPPPAPQRVAATSADLPFYARIERGLIHTDGEWAAIAFYRPPSCVPDLFNLLDFFDFAAFDCNAPAPYLTGLAVWKDPETLIQSRLQLAPGQTMPVWFVSWQELETAIADDVLTIGELTGIPSLQVGVATFYTETLHPAGAAQQTMTSIVAAGHLGDGRAFHYKAVETHHTLRQVKIELD